MSLQFCLNVDFNALATALASFPSTPSTSTAARTQHKELGGNNNGHPEWGEKEKTTDEDQT